jgi:hypothetical protein
VDTAADERLTQIPVSEQWDAAYQRVDHYLHAMHIRNRPVLNKLVQRILERSLQRIEHGENRAPAEVAGEEMMHTLARWFQSVLPVEDGESEVRPGWCGARLALIMSRDARKAGARAVGGVGRCGVLAELGRAYSLTGRASSRLRCMRRPLEPGRVDRAAEGRRWPRSTDVPACAWCCSGSFCYLFGLIFYYTR